MLRPLSLVVLGGLVTSALLSLVLLPALYLRFGRRPARRAGSRVRRAGRRSGRGGAAPEPGDKVLEPVGCGTARVLDQAVIRVTVRSPRPCRLFPSRLVQWTVSAVAVIGVVVAVTLMLRLDPPGAESEDRRTDVPAKVEAVAGQKVKRVTLTAEAAKRLDVQTATVRTGRSVASRS